MKPLILGRGLGPEAQVRIGGLWFKPDQVPSTLGRYAKHVVCRNDTEDFPYTLRGSGSAIRRGSACFLQFCKHQVVGYHPDLVGIQHDGRMLTGSRVISPTATLENAAEEFVDLCAMHFRPDDYVATNLPFEFFDVKNEELWPRNTTGHLLVLGFPTIMQSVDYLDARRIDATQVWLAGQHVAPSTPGAAHLFAFDDALTFDPDGLSGGPVFHLGRDGNGVFVGFAGIVTRGSGLLRRLQFVPPGIPVRLIDEYARDLG